MGSHDCLAGVGAGAGRGPPSLCVPASVYMPSFTSGFLPLDLPRHLRGKLNKRGESFVDSWHFGRKRAPWTSSWANILWRPQVVNNNGPEKRSALASLSMWNSPIGNYLRSPRGFRYSEGSRDWLEPSLVSKRGLDF